MRKFAIILASLGVAAIIITLIFFLLGFFKPKGAGILVETNPTSVVYINGISVGKSRYEAIRNPGEVTIKLVPDATDKQYSPYETRVALSPGIKTIVRHDFGETEDTSAGETVSFERTGGSEAAVSIVTIPDAGQISIDGTKRAFAPYKTSSLTPGEHQIIISSPGYLDRTLLVNTVSGYKLIAVIKLASNTTPPAPTPTPSPQSQTLIEILPTNTGYLRVRESPGPSGKELVQVKPGQRFLYIDTDSQTGWFKIEYAPAKQGWVTNTFSKKIEGILD